MTFNAAAYYYKYDNLQVPIVDPVTNTQQSINAAKATISGLEIEAAYRPNDRFSKPNWAPWVYRTLCRLW